MNTTMRHTNLDYLKLMADGDQDMEKMMLGMLLAELPEEFEKMKTLLQEENWEDLGKVSHKMKSTLAFIGNDDMTNANKSIELSCKKMENIEQVPALMNQFGNLLPAVMQELKEVHAGY